MNLSTPHLLFLVANTTYLLTRGYYQFQRASKEKTISKATIRDWLLITFLVFGQVVLPTLLLFTPWIDVADYSLPPATTWAGGLVMAVGLWLFWRSHADLGDSWSVTLELNSNHKLITNGVYRCMRHPMYASFFLMAIGQALLLSNWLAGWSALVATTVLYVMRIPHEEKMMIEFFGDEYRAYCLHTNGIIPSWGAGRTKQD